MNKDRITVLLGAGYAIPLGGPSTQKITDEIVKTHIDEIDETLLEKLMESIKADEKIVAHHYTPNFEDLFHVIEIIWSYIRKEDVDEEIDWNRVIFKGIKYDISVDEVIKISQKIYSIIFNEIRKYNDNAHIEKIETWEKNKKFWDELLTKWKIDFLILNYDTTVEQMLGEDNYQDGFFEDMFPLSQKILKHYHVKRFIPQKLDEKNNNLIMHLHGCIKYGPKTMGLFPKDIKKLDYEDSNDDVYKYDSIDGIMEEWNAYWEESKKNKFFMRPIITGGNKANKILINPYQFYHFELQRALIENKYLLIIGYSFSDSYLNSLLMRMKQLHGGKRRIVIITYINDDDKREIDNINLGGPDAEEINILNRLLPIAKEYDRLMGEPVRYTLAKSIQRNENFTKFGENGIIYYCGVEKAFERYGKEIKEFIEG